MVTSNTVNGFVPVDAPLYTTPVQVTGHTVANLTVAQSPDGQAIFGWSSGGVFYCAVNPDFDSVYKDDVIPDGDERVVFDETLSNWDVDMGSVWVDRGDLFCAVKTVMLVYGPDYYRGLSICYMADDPENPVVWTQRGLIDMESGYGIVDDIHSAGPPLVLESGRWVMPFATFAAYGGTGVADQSAIVVSDDRGIDWTVAYSHRRGPIFSGTTGPISDTIGQDPLTGFLYWSHYDGPGVNEAFVLESQDEGDSWQVVVPNAATTWNFTIDDGVSKLYGTRDILFTEWEWWDMVDPTDDGTYVDLDIAAIPSDQNGTQFQAIVFLNHGSIAFIDRNRVAGYFFGCTVPEPLHIPYKDRLEKLQVDGEGKPDASSYNLMADHDADNLKTIERWAARWMTDADSPDSCELFIPHKDHLRHAVDGDLTPMLQRAIAEMSFDNYKTIERWALRTTRGECACTGPTRCLLHIPFKDAIAALTVDADGAFDIPHLVTAASQDFENYKVIERWANAYARRECFDDQQVYPPGGFPDPPASPARLAGELIEVSVADASVVRFPGEMMEVSTQPGTTLRFTGEMIEVAVTV